MSTTIEALTPLPPPGFGEIPIDDRTHQHLSLQEKIKLIALAAFAMLAVALAAAGIGFLIASGVGALVGGALGATAISVLGIYLKTARSCKPVPSTQGMFPQDPTVPAIGEKWEGHDILLVPNGREAIMHMMTLLDQAEQSFESTLNYGGKLAKDDTIFAEFLDKIDANLAAKPKLKIHLIISQDILTKEHRKKLSEIEHNYSNRFHPLITKQLLFIGKNKGIGENHTKMDIVDGQVFRISSGGISGQYNQPKTLNSEDCRRPSFRQRALGLASRDMTGFVMGPLAEKCREEFFKLYAVMEYREAKKKPKALKNRFWKLEPTPQKAFCSLQSHPDFIEDVAVKFTISDPDNPTNHISDEYVRLIDEAEKVIRITNFIFIPDPKIKAALIRARNRGVRIELVTNGAHPKAPWNVKIISPANRMDYDLVDKVYEIHIPGTLFHEKAMLIDEKVWILGSYNFSLKSSYFDQETAATFRSKKAAQAMLEIFNEHVKNSREYQGAEKKRLNSRWQTRILGPIVRAIPVPICF